MAGCQLGPADESRRAQPLAEALDLGSTDLAKDPRLADRPYQWRVPKSYDPTRPTPLVLLLHGRAVDGPIEELYFQLGQLVDSRGFLYAYPNGKKDLLGLSFWNATDDCCDTFHSGVDDVGYLSAVIGDMSARYNVDPKRIFIIGHSNGGYMAHRLACDRADLIAAFVSLAGDNWKDLKHCRPAEPMAMLQIHGDADTQVPYLGTATAPSAHDSVAGWAQLDGCSTSTDTTTPAPDIVRGLPLTRERWLGCPAGAAELWTIKGGGHIPPLKQPQWPVALWDYLSAHAKP